MWTAELLHPRRTFELGLEPYTIGREGSAVDLVIQGKLISRVHAILRPVLLDGRETHPCWALEDHSRNGIFLSNRGKRMEAGAKAVNGE